MVVSMSSILQDLDKDQLVITLNRPQALNALNHEMVLKIMDILNNARDDNAIAGISFKGEGDRAFCAGGDVKAVYYVGLDDYDSACAYFSDEYKMNAMIFDYPKPIASLCHGYVMGGGYGVAGNGRRIIVDETTRFAMPETAIGFFPDVGIGWKLARAGALGLYIALTGGVFDADMMMAAGLATESQTEITPIETLSDIETHFSKNTLEEVFQSLEQDDGDFANKTLQTLQSRCPISLHVTFHHLRLALHETYHQSIARDERLAHAFFSKPDIYEGIRAQLIDKDKSPKWSHSSIYDVPQGDIDYYLQFGDND